MSEDFRGFFPGSKTPLPGEPTKEKTAPEKAAWDARPVVKVVKGQEVQFFTIGALCAALGRPPVTVRLWIRKGRLPAASYRMPDRNGIKGRRLYTRAQIEAIIEVATRHGIIDNPRVDWSKHSTFADDIRTIWSTLTLT